MHYFIHDFERFVRAAATVTILSIVVITVSDGRFIRVMGRVF